MGTFLSLLGRFVPRWGGRKQHSFRRNYLTTESHGGMEKKWKRNGKNGKGQWRFRAEIAVFWGSGDLREKGKRGGTGDL
jgi:hypothetical protein